MSQYFILSAYMWRDLQPKDGFFITVSDQFQPFCDSVIQQDIYANGMIA